MYSVINALKNGQSIQMSNNKRSWGSVDHIEYSNMEDEFVAVNIWEVYLVSTCTFGPRREKTCLRGLRKSDIQISLLSYRNKLEN